MNIEPLDLEEMIRRRLAYDLHDGLGVRLSSTRMALSSRYESSSNPEVLACLADCIKALDELYIELRNTLTQLAPAALQEGRLYDALVAFVSKIEDYSGLLIELDLDEGLNKLSSGSAVQLFRIIQELINNTLKHAGAKRITLSCWMRDNSLELEYSDDGKGFVEPKVSGGSSHTYGISSIKERVARLNGKCTFESKPGEGMIFYLSVPRAALTA